MTIVELLATFPRERTWLLPAKTGAPESKVLAGAMLDIADRAQLVLGHSVLTLDLKAFLRRAGVE